MDFEIIQKEVKYTYPVINCFVCNKVITGQCTYAFVKNTFYCPECVKDLPNINSVFDNKFRDIDKKIEDLTNGMVDKNTRIKKLLTMIELLNDHVKELDDKTDALNKVILELVDEDDEIENKKLEENKKIEE